MKDYRMSLTHYGSLFCWNLVVHAGLSSTLCVSVCLKFLKGNLTKLNISNVGRKLWIYICHLSSDV